MTDDRRRRPEPQMGPLEALANILAIYGAIALVMFVAYQLTGITP